MHRVGHVVAVAPHRGEMDAPLAGLAIAGVHSEVVEPEPGVYELEDESFPRRVRGGRQGLPIGLLLGALVGLTVVVLVPAARGLPGAARLLLAGGIALQGTMPAVMWRIGRLDHYHDDPELTREVTADDRLVIVDDEHNEARARRVLERHHAAFLIDEHPVALAD